MSSFFKQFSFLEKIVISVVFIIFCNNLFLDIMQIDAAQYSGISAEMAQTHSYLEVKEFGNDYLDKPPLLFWISSLSIQFFGINNFAYKFPSFLFLLLSLVSIFKFCQLFYSEKVAKNAVLIFATSQAYFLMTNDVRTDAILTSSVITAIWLFSEYFERKKLKFLIFGSFFIALAMMAKGPIGLIAVLLPLGFNLIYHKKWKLVFGWHWLLVCIIIALLLFPMSYGLYTQYDLQTEKIAYGKKGQSGLYFYYWLQSFGRITGENTWNNGTPFHFFLGSTLWDFFPWILPLYFSIFTKLKSVFSSNKNKSEIISLVGFLSIFLMLSLSKYKLPHYVFVTFPFAAIFIGDYFSNLKLKQFNNWKIIFMFFGILILLLISIYPILFFKELNFILFFCILLQIGILIYFSKQKQEKSSVFQLISIVLVLNIFLSFVFYPKLLTFQSDSVAGKWSFEKIQNQPIYTYEIQSHAFNFYSKNPFIKAVDSSSMQTIEKPYWLFIEKSKLKAIKKYHYNKIESFDSYPITKLKLPFLLSKTREQQLEKKYLIRIVN